jgi:hypothetical protein
MAETETDAGKSKTTVGDLRDMIKEIVAETIKGATPDTTTGDNTPDTDGPKGTETTGERARGVAALVAAEVKKIQEKDAADARDQTIQEKLDELSKATAEKPPVERRRVHRAMGWGEPPQ